MNSSLVHLLRAFPHKRILVIGDVMLDEYLWGTVRRISPEAPVPVVELQRRSYLPGGAANTAANVAGLQGEVHLFGVIGADEAGRQLGAALANLGISPEGLLVDAGRPTTSKTRIIAHAQQVVRVDQEQGETLSTILEEQMLERITARLSSVDACILSDYAKGVVTTKLAQQVIECTLARRIPLVVDPKGTEYSKYRGATLIKPNLQEISQYLQCAVASLEEVRKAGEALLHEMDGEAVLVTCGAAGMSLFQRGLAPLHIPAQAREVYDVTGAGDTVAGTVAMALSAGASFEQAARLASQAAALIVARIGTTAVQLHELLAVSAD